MCSVSEYELIFIIFIAFLGMFCFYKMGCLSGGTEAHKEIKIMLGISTNIIQEQATYIKDMEKIMKREVAGHFRISMN